MGWKFLQIMDKLVQKFDRGQSSNFDNNSKRDSKFGDTRILCVMTGKLVLIVRSSENKENKRVS